MKNGNVGEFIDHIHYGDELWFLYEKKKYLLEGWSNDNRLKLCLYEISDSGAEYMWEGDSTHYPVEAFLKDKIWNGKAFWDIEQEIEWIDC